MNKNSYNYVSLCTVTIGEAYASPVFLHFGLYTRASSEEMNYRQGESTRVKCTSRHALATTHYYF